MFVSHSLPFMLLLVAALCAVVAAQNDEPKPSKNPCHRTRRSTGDGQEDCGVYVVPKKMCAKCSIKDWNMGTGNFFSCRSIFGVTATGCMEQLAQYVRHNKCDQKRNADFEILQNPSHPKYSDALDSMDYFLYAICESCCDCVPMKSTTGEYKQRKKDGTLFKADRGNCPAHARADVCKVWPNVRAVVNGPSAVAKVSPSRPEICPIMRNWLEDIKTKGGWYNKPQVEITPAMRVFLDELMKKIGCRNRKTWRRCVKLEKTQKRL